MRRVYLRRRLVALSLAAASVGLIVLAISAIGDAGGGAQSPGPSTLASSPTAPGLDEPRALESADLEPHLGPVPILMYHVISAPPVGAAAPELFVTADDFKAQLSWLADEGFVGVTQGQVFDAWYEGGELPAKPVVVSMDDGYASQYGAAASILAKLGWPGVLNLKVEALDQGEITEDQVKEMVGAGWEIGAHTVTHADVTALSGASLEAEVAGSRRILERRLGAAVDFFCYPAGRYDGESVAAVKAAGYVGATTTEAGLASSDAPFTLKRLRVNGSMGLSGFQEMIRSEGLA